MIEKIKTLIKIFVAVLFFVMTTIFMVSFSEAHAIVMIWIFVFSLPLPFLINNGRVKKMLKSILHKVK